MTKAVSASLVVLGVMCGDAITASAQVLNFSKSSTICIGDPCTPTWDARIGTAFATDHPGDGDHVIDAYASMTCKVDNAFDSYVSAFTGAAGGMIQGSARCTCNPGRTVTPTGCD
jgi:hypothetical protein